LLAVTKLEKLADREVGRRIRQARKDRGLRLKDVAPVMGMTPQALSQVEKGISGVPQAEALLRFCARYGEDPYHILFGRSLSSVVGRLRSIDPEDEPKPRGGTRPK